MEKTKTLVSQHKKASLLTLFALIVLIGLPAMSAMNVTRQRAVEETAETKSADEQGISDDGKDAEEKVELSSFQKKFIDGYDDEMKKLIETLSASVSFTNNGRNTLRFHDDYHVKTVNDKEQNHSYVISIVEPGNNGSDNEIDRIVFETDIGTHTAIFTLVISANNVSAGECTTTSTLMFKPAGMPYERKDTVKEINATGLNSEVMELLGNIDGMKKQLSDWCSIHFPAATTTTWIGTCNIDYNEDTILTAFTIDDGNSSEATGGIRAFVSVTYNRSKKKYSLLMQAISSGGKVR